MDSKNFILSVLSGIVCAIICATARYFYQSIKRSSAVDENINARHSKKILRIQFSSYLLALVIIWSIAFLTSSVFIKQTLIIFSGFLLLFIEGTFEEALRFYPVNNARNTKPPKPTTK